MQYTDTHTHWQCRQCHSLNASTRRVQFNCNHSKWTWWHFTLCRMEEQGGTGLGEQRQTQRQQKRSKLKQQRTTTITRRGGRNAPKAQLEKQSTKQRFEFRSKQFHRHLLLTRWRSRYTMDLHCTGPVHQSPCHTPAPPLPVVAGTATQVECNQCLERLPRATECATL